MATRRIKDITNTATTFASDDFIALDGSTQGTRKMDKDDLIAEISAGVSGDYLEEANNLSDVASLDTSKLNMEIPDVGTAPNEVPLNGQLGTMAFQDADGVSVGTVEADQIGIGTSSPSSYYFAANQLVIGDGADNKGMTIASGPGSTGNVVFADTGSTTIGRIQYNHGTNEMKFRVNDSERVTIDSAGRVGIGTASPSELLHLSAPSGGVNSRALSRAHFGGQHANHALVLGYCAKADSATNERMVVTETSGTGATANPAAIRMSTGSIAFHTANTGTSGAAFDSLRWSINSSGNLVANGTAIDFGSGATLDDYETGTWTPYFAPTTGSFTALTMDVLNARYVKVGNFVHLEAYIRTDNVDTTGASGNLKIMGLPFTVADYAAVNVEYSQHWTNMPLEGYANSTAIYLGKRATTNSDTAIVQVSDMTNGASLNVNKLIFAVSYYTAA